MALTQQQLQDRKDKLILAITSGHKKVSFEGMNVEYQSIDDMQRALNMINQQLSETSGGRRIRRRLAYSSKG